MIIFSQREAQNVCQTSENYIYKMQAFIYLFSFTEVKRRRVGVDLIF